MSRVFVVMGVSGSGKTTVGKALAAQLNCPFHDADDFHPAENVAKMAQGIPLNDQDRAPWLARLAALLADYLAHGETAVLACSALKKTYRQQLRVTPHVQFIHLAGTFQVIWQRMQAREDHYMKADMLQSQFATLEPPTANEATTIDIDQDIDTILTQVLALVGKEKHLRQD